MIPHKHRLYAIAILTLLDLVTPIAAKYGLELDAHTFELITTAVLALASVLVPALGDALLVERRRRDPTRPAIPDDVLDTIELEEAADG